MSEIRNNGDYSRTITRRTESNTQHQKAEREQAASNSRHTTTPNNNSTSTTIDTEPGVFLSPMDMEAIRQTYNDILGTLNFIKARDIEWAIRSGLKAGAILDAIEQTAMAHRPSHPYLVAILERYISYGIHTREDAERDRIAHKARRDAANRERWNAWYKNPEDDMPW